MRLPSKKRPGNPVLAADWNLLIDALQSRTPRTGPGMELVSSSGGFTYRPRPVAGGGQTAAAPLTLIGGSANNKIRVVPGYVNGLMPKIGTAFLDVLSGEPPMPPEITLAAAETHVWIKCVADFGGSGDTYVFTIETTNSSSPPATPVISGTGFTSYFHIGVCRVEGTGENAVVTITNGQGGNLGVDSFGNINLWWRQ